jgi:hypothetical protein
VVTVTAMSVRWKSPDQRKRCNVRVSSSCEGALLRMVLKASRCAMRDVGGHRHLQDLLPHHVGDELVKHDVARLYML